MDFKEMLEMLRNPGETGLPDDFADQLEQAHTHEVSVREAKIAEVENSYSTATEELAKTKAHNYDLIRATPAHKQEPDRVVDDGKPKSFDDLFTTE